MDRADFQRQQQQELHERTVLALTHAKAGCATEDDISLLAWHAGVDYKREIENVERLGGN